MAFIISLMIGVVLLVCIIKIWIWTIKSLVDWTKPSPAEIAWAEKKVKEWEAKGYLVKKDKE